MSKKKPLSEELLEECDAAHRIFLEKKNALKLSQKKIADAAGISAPAVNHYFKGVNPLNLQFAAVLARLLEVSVSDFSPRLAAEIEQITEAVRTEPGSKESNVIAADFSQKRTDMVDIPRLDVAGSMGFGITRPDDHEDVIDRLRVSTAWLRRNVNATNHDNLAVITGYGDSMEGTFNDGDLLLVDRGVTDIKIDAVYVLALKGELYIKRLQRRPDGTILMLSDNEKYKPYEIKDGELDQFEVLGRVLLAWNARRL